MGIVVSTTIVQHDLEDVAAEDTVEKLANEHEFTAQHDEGFAVQTVIAENAPNDHTFREEEDSPAVHAVLVPQPVVELA